MYATWKNQASLPLIFKGKQFHDATNAHIVIQSWSQMNTAMGTFEMYSKAADQGKRSRLSLVWNNVRSVREWGFDDMVAECMCA